MALLFCKLISPGDCVLDLGCGYGDFINNVVARRRIAIDSWEGFLAYVDPPVERVIGNVMDLNFIEEGGVGFVLASNFFEHLSKSTFVHVLTMLRTKLYPRGTLNILQRNYRYVYREYFDDYTQVSVFSHLSLADVLRAHGFEPLEIRPRFLPLTIRSRVPVSPWLIKAYSPRPVWPGDLELCMPRL